MERNILFLCTGNSARSQMAEALLRKHAGRVLQPFSAGTAPKPQVLPPVVAVMKEIGIDISAQKPKNLSQFLGKKQFEYVIIVCANAERNCPAALMTGKRLFWPFDDPAQARGTEEQVLETCRKVRDQIDKRIRQWLKELDLL